ncbi:hypothetical protein pb186bvf_014944 [Paramecium bursaria]
MISSLEQGDQKTNLINKQMTEVYMIRNQKEFWHCQLISTEPITTQIRSGFLNSNWEVPESVQSRTVKHITYDKAVDVISNTINEKLKQNFHEINPHEVVKAYEQGSDDEQLQQLLLDKIDRFIAQNQPTQQQYKASRRVETQKKQAKQQKVIRKQINNDKSLFIGFHLYQLSDMVMGDELIKEWPRCRQRTQLGETHDLGPDESRGPGGFTMPSLWDDQQDPTGYYMSEKIDGVRIMWTGCEMMTKTNHSVDFPTYFVEGWPTTYLDGMLWIGRNCFSQLTNSLRKRQADPAQWRNIKFIVFDAPMLNQPYHQRYKLVKKVLEKIKNTNLVFMPQVFCQGWDHLNIEMQYIQELQSRGIILRDPNSIYEPKKSQKFFKIRSYMEDQATVTGVPDETKSPNNPNFGEIYAKNQDGVQFKIDMTGKKKILNIGDVIIYQFYGKNHSNRPRFPSFVKLFSNKK